MRVEDFRELSVLAETLSFTETARRLYATQSALSKHIKSIEEELDADLFTRSKNGIYLTRAGRLYSEYANQMVKLYDDSIEAINQLKSGHDESLRVGYLLGAAGWLLKQAFSSFERKHPDANVQFVTMEIDEILDALKENRIDVGILTEYVQVPSGRFKKEPLYKDYLRLVVKKEHRLAKRESVRIADLMGEHLMLANSNFMVRERPFFDNILQTNIENIQITRSASDIHGLLLMVEAGNYVTISFDHLKHYPNTGGSLRFIPIEECPEGFNVSVVWKGSAENVLINDFARVLKECVPHDFSL